MNLLRQRTAALQQIPVSDAFRGLLGELSFLLGCYKIPREEVNNYQASRNEDHGKEEASHVVRH